MGFQDNFPAVSVSIFSQIGRVITYNSVEIYAIVEKGTEIEKQAGLIFSDAQIEILKSDIPNPAVADVIIIDSITYRFGKIFSEDDQAWTLAINKANY